ncbi:triphosphoribosyl-dephospho-CoA synthase [Pseudaminobacter arsenicus]|uniref:Triphosphoribosyl-dephospho-CoA synthase n=1 Tax=Borborobacter arsenicus TaxID=1851146 RepID=A0A432V453_9HYPH|nr:triphosphoribosyl-dephospho-CoA synthase [Pseudaminobacter arsenicus]RUM96890.1 triphosphoribosyl-dephospho-CoA synthase [Pseudaminobacter arsenicus]
MLTRDMIRAAFEAACRQEIEALKPGNVHLFADGHCMSAEQFLTSARVSSGPLTDPSLPLGKRIHEAVRATRDAVATNTNLGILLLCGPLAYAAGMPGKDFRANIRMVLQAITLQDTEAVFEAITLASPGGLGEAPAHDVREKPKVTLLEAMRTAADRDMIAKQYIIDFADIFDVGLPTIETSLARGESGMWPAIRVYLKFLTAFPDSHVLRKHGADTAARLREEAIAVETQLDKIPAETARIDKLLDFDRNLKARGINPGTSADLTVACLLVHTLGRDLA